MKLGVFDSGHGGEFVSEKLASLLPEYEYMVVNDLAYAPYGERSYEEIRQLTLAAIQPLLNCDVIVIACNTATVAAIRYLREKYPDTLFVGFEPMIKPAAAQTKTSRITLLATHATQHSPRTEELIELYADGITVDRPPTLGWASAIDNEEADTIAFDHVNQSVANGSDTIIIGCTHYIALIPRLKEAFPNITILEPTEAVAQQIARVTAN